MLRVAAGAAGRRAFAGRSLSKAILPAASALPSPTLLGETASLHRRTLHASDRSNGLGTIATPGFASLPLPPSTVGVKAFSTEEEKKENQSFQWFLPR